MHLSLKAIQAARQKHCLPSIFQPRLAGRSVLTLPHSNFSAFGGASCSTQGVDYETISGTFRSTRYHDIHDTGKDLRRHQCRGERNLPRASLERFRCDASRQSRIGTIVNDDMLELVLEESGPNPNQAAALDAITWSQRSVPRGEYSGMVPDR